MSGRADKSRADQIAYFEDRKSNKIRIRQFDIVHWCGGRDI